MNFSQQIGDLIAAVHSMSDSIRSISHGKSQPEGLEALSIAVAGQHLENPLGQAWAGGCSEIASAIREAGDDVARGLLAVSESIDARVAATTDPIDHAVIAKPPTTDRPPH